MTFVYYPNVAKGYVTVSDAPKFELQFQSTDVDDPGTLVAVTLCGVDILKCLPDTVKERLATYSDQVEKWWRQ